MTDLLKRIYFKISGSVVRLSPIGKSRGNVLISYTTIPFRFPEKMNAHPVRFDCKCMADTFLSHGFSVDIIEYDNKKFKPHKEYSYCIDVQDNLDRLAPLLNPDCVKIYHIPAAHWQFQNNAEYKRLLDIRDRRGFVLSPKRTVPPSFNMEHADLATALIGTNFVTSTYAYAKKPIRTLHVTTPHTCAKPSSKDVDVARKNFLWIGGAGMAHKGLDLVLEAFAAMPEFNLTVYGKKDIDFAQAYKKELEETPNIRYAGHIDMGSREFMEVAARSLGVISVSASEGGNSATLDAMHAGVLPIAGYTASVYTGDFGILLPRSGVKEIQDAVRTLSSLPATDLKARSIAAWKYVEDNHTKAVVTKEYEVFISELVAQHPIK